MPRSIFRKLDSARVVAAPHDLRLCRHMIEDPLPEMRCLRLLREEKVQGKLQVLTIASAGCTSFALVASCPESEGGIAVTAIDFNAAQVACSRLREAALLQLTQSEVLDLFANPDTCSKADDKARC